MIHTDFLQRLVRFARQQNYDEAEGFADSSVTLNLPDDARELLETVAAELASAAGVSESVALNALIRSAGDHALCAFHEGKLSGGLGAYIESKRTSAN